MRAARAFTISIVGCNDIAEIPASEMRYSVLVPVLVAMFGTEAVAQLPPGAVPAVPLASASADLVYTGKGAVIWMPDLTAWAGCLARLLRLHRRRGAHRLR